MILNLILKYIKALEYPPKKDKDGKRIYKRNSRLKKQSIERKYVSRRRTRLSKKGSRKY